MEPIRPEFYVSPEHCKLHQWYDMGVGGRCYKCGITKTECTPQVIEPKPISTSSDQSVINVVEPAPLKNDQPIEPRKRGRPKKIIA